MENRYDLSGSLLHWYDYNKRLLPWRENKDPYRIWISEIMLQQTRVEAVKPYFDRFMEALPTVYDLAEVEDDRLMKLWEGLLESKPFCSNSVRSIRIVVPLTPNFLINSVLLTRLLTLSISKIFSCLSSANMYDNFRY